MRRLGLAVLAVVAACSGNGESDSLSICGEGTDFPVAVVVRPSTGEVGEDDGLEISNLTAIRLAEPPPTIEAVESWLDDSLEVTTRRTESSGFAAFSLSGTDADGTCQFTIVRLDGGPEFVRSGSRLVMDAGRRPDP